MPPSSPSPSAIETFNFSLPTPPPPAIKISAPPLPTPPLPPIIAHEGHEFGMEQNQSDFNDQQTLIVDDESDDDCDEYIVQKEQIANCHTDDDCDVDHDDHDELCPEKELSASHCKGAITCLSGSLIGIKGKNFEDIFDLYSKHASEVGFSIRRSTTRYNADGVLVRRWIVCSRAGKQKLISNIDVNVNLRKSLRTRTECKALLKVKVDVDGCCEVIGHYLDHNHTLSRSEWSYMHRSQRSIGIEKGVVIEDMISSGMRPIESFRVMAHNAGGEDVLGHTKRDHLNFVNRLRMIAIEGGDAQTLIDILHQQGVEDQEFFFRVKLDDDGRLCNVFWRDSMMKEDYMIYGDVVVFDTTYRTNKYNLICAPFVGMNNHKKNVMFGCAFISDEKIGSFEWLFEVFLKSMEGKAPLTIFTDQDQAMMSAIEKIFPFTRHRLCTWHLYRNALTHLGLLKSNKSFANEFDKCLSGCTNEAEFESCWASMISKYQLEENSWLTRIYELRMKWCNAFNKDFFSGGILSSQRSESTNSSLGFKATKSTNLNDFYIIFKKTVERWRSNEATDEFQCSRGMPTSCLPMNGLVKHASQVYTHTLFKDFENEFLKSTSTSFTFLHEEDDVKLYNVIHEGSEYQVYFYMMGSLVSCTCKRFEECGLLCCHCLRIMHAHSVVEIPDCYIKVRWSKLAKQSLWDKLAPSKMKSCSPWRHQVMREFYNLLLKTQNSEDEKTVIEDELNNIRSALEALVISKENTAEINDFEGVTSSVTVRDPSQSMTKGRRKRIKGHLEKKMKKRNNSDSSTSKKLKEFGSKTPNPRVF